MFNLFGYLGSICLAVCAAPQAWKSYKDKQRIYLIVGLITIGFMGAIIVIIIHFIIKFW